MDGKSTIYSIPTKMLYDPAPLNIPNDPGHFLEDPGYAISDGNSGRRLVQQQHLPLQPPNSSIHRRRSQMVWFEGDERALYPLGEDGSSCSRDWVSVPASPVPGHHQSAQPLFSSAVALPPQAKFDPACGAVRRTHVETAYVRDPDLNLWAPLELGASMRQTAEDRMCVRIPS